MSDDLEAILRSMTERDLTLEDPPPSVWDGIEAALAADDTPPPVADLAAHRSRTTRRFGILLGAVAAAVVLILGIGLLAGSDDPGFREVATAQLTYDPETFDPGGAGHSATTTLIADNGVQRIRFDAADLPTPPEGEDVELWLIGLDTDGDIEIIQPVGFVDNLDAPGEFDVPEGFSTDDYAAVAVDLSFEPRDGDESHSGRSILRGALTA